MEIDMKDFRNYWKTLHANKAITCRDVIQLCILRAMRSKGDTEAVLKHLLHKAFKPKNYARDPYEAISRTSATVNIRNKFQIFGTDWENIFENEEEVGEFNLWAQSLRATGKLIRHYSYFFTRQDIFPEYQLVQTAHAALELGATLKPEQVRNLHFTCCGVRNLEELEMIESVLTSLGHRFITFREPDIGNEKTAIAVEPIAENRRGILRNYPLLSFKQK
jgi:hypothetical protein